MKNQDAVTNKFSASSCGTVQIRVYIMITRISASKDLAFPFLHHYDTIRVILDHQS